VPEQADLADTAFLYPGLASMWAVPARGELRLSEGRLAYSITDPPPEKVVEWVERSTRELDLAERLRDWTGPVEVLDVSVAELRWKISWTTSWNMLALKVQGTKWRIRFTPSSGEIDAEEARGAKIGRRWRKALREAA